MSLFVLYLLPAVVVAIALLLIREARQHRSLLARLKPGAPRDIRRAARAEAASRIANGPGTSGRAFRASDLLHWGALLLLAAPVVLWAQTVRADVHHWLILEWLALPGVAWWLTMRRNGVRNAHRPPIVAWLAAYATVLAAVAFRQAEFASVDSFFFDSFLLAEWLGEGGATAAAGIVLVAAGASATFAVATISRRANALSDVALIAGALVVASMVWSVATLPGILNVALTAGIVGYGIARAYRLDAEKRDYAQALALLDGGVVGVDGGDRRAVAQVRSAPAPAPSAARDVSPSRCAPTPSESFGLAQVPGASTPSAAPDVMPSGGASSPGAVAGTALRTALEATAIGGLASLVFLLPTLNALPLLAPPLTAGIFAAAVAGARVAVAGAASGSRGSTYLDAARVGALALLIAVEAYSAAYIIGFSVAAAIGVEPAASQEFAGGYVLLAAVIMVPAGLATVAALVLAARKRLSRWSALLLAIIWLPVGIYVLQPYTTRNVDGDLVAAWLFAMLMLAALLVTMTLPLNQSGSASQDLPAVESEPVASGSAAGATPTPMRAEAAP